MSAVNKKVSGSKAFKSKARKGAGDPQGIKLSILLSLGMAHFAANRLDGNGCSRMGNQGYKHRNQT
ncbi:hypothetical protein [Paraglaciecola sp. MB-3u-78]|uniref:hypothetical protein n=1 Tax=Paraglaciecola sp. MB-3u-78 TaxID=2058332 RepID=UPI0012FF0E92|nr:hypothetical protein [Paraglaciecola sp. MB-3u-78]